MNGSRFLRVANNSPDFVPLDEDYQSCDLSTYFDRIAKRFPDRLAIADDDQSYTYHQALVKTNQVATVLKSKEVAGQVAVFLPNCAEMVVAFWGVMKVGCVAVMIDPALPKERADYMLRDAQVSAVITVKEYAEEVSKIIGSEVSVILIGEGSSEDHPEVELPEISVNQPAVLVYTSGSTGKPKGILHTHKAWMTSIGWVAQCEKYVPEDRIAQVYSPSSAASLIGIVYALLTGASIHMFDTDRYSLPYFIDWLAEKEITAFRMTGTAFRQVFAGKPEPEKMKNIRLAMIGGEMIHQTDHDIFKAWFPKSALQRVGGGSTEVLLIASCYLQHHSLVESKHMPMGCVFDPVTVEIWDDTDRPLPVGEMGEIIVRGPTVANGYWNQSVESGGFFIDPDEPEAYAYRMGDLGYLSDDGLLYISGRKDEMVKVRGFRVEISEVEARLIEVKGVNQAVIASVPYRTGSYQLVAYIVPDIQYVPSIRSIQKELSQSLPYYMIPARYVFLKKLPINNSGKVDKLALPKPGRHRPDLEVDYVEPTNYMEIELVDIWSEVLGFDKIGIDDDFTQLGGDSLAAAQIFILAEETVNTKFPPSILINSPTIRALASKMINIRRGQEDAMIVLQDGNPGKPTVFLFAPLFGDAIIYRDLLQQFPPEYRVIGLHSWTKDHETYGEKSIDEMLDEFLPLILDEQKEGPFYFGGFSLGGALAYQAAFRLKQCEKEIGFVFMLDSNGPGVVNKFDPQEYLYWFKQQTTFKEKFTFLLRGFTKVYQSALMKIRSFWPHKELETKTNETKDRVYPPESVKPGAMYVPYTVLKVPYAAPKCDIDVILFTSDVRQGARKGAGFALGWNKVVQGELQVIHLAGTHDDHFRGENAKKIVEALLMEMESK